MSDPTSDVIYTIFHDGGGYCCSSEHIWISDGTLKYKDEVIAWHEGSKDYFYVQIPRLSRMDAKVLRILRKIMPEGRKDFIPETGVLYIVHKSGAIEGSDLTFGDMYGIL